MRAGRILLAQHGDMMIRYEFEGKLYPSPSNGSWVCSKEKFDKYQQLGRLQVKGKSLSYRLFFTFIIKVHSVMQIIEVALTRWRIQIAPPTVLSASGAMFMIYSLVLL